MNSRSRGRLAVVLVVLGCVFFGPFSLANDETILWNLWSSHMASPDQHEAHAAAFTAFSAEQKNSPLVPVADTLAAWHLLKLGRQEEAKALLALYINSTNDGAFRGARDLARAWLTCLDRDSLAKALEYYREREVRYPAKLSEVAAYPQVQGIFHPVYQDRWGNPWVYRLERLKSMPLLSGQRYTLESRMLATMSDLDIALKQAYAGNILLDPVRVIDVQNRPPTVQLKRSAGSPGAGEILAIMAGSGVGGISVARVNTRFIILYDRLHWKIYPTPNRKSP